MNPDSTAEHPAMPQAGNPAETGDAPVFKSCRDCRFVSIGIFDRVLIGFKFAKCLHPKSYQRDDWDLLDAMVTGKKQKPNPGYFYFASVMRRHTCGADAKLFEPKP